MQENKCFASFHTDYSVNFNIFAANKKAFTFLIPMNLFSLS